MNIVLSFEEPHGPMLLASGVLLFAAPIGMLVHIATTSELTLHEKRLWLTNLARGNPRLFAAYFNRTERRATTRALASSR